MADVALWSGATGTGDGSSWENAYTTLSAATTAQGNQATRIFVASDHLELVATTIIFPGSVLTPYQLVSCDRTSGFPPTAEQAGARIGSTSGTNLTIQNSFYSKGVFWTAGEGSTATRNFSFDSGIGNHIVKIVNGGIELRNTGSGSRFICGTGATNRNTKIILENSEVRFGHAGQGFSVLASSISINEGVLAGAAITELIKVVSTVAVDVDVHGFDMSTAATSANLVASGTLGIGQLRFNKIKMPTNWTGGIMATPPAQACLRAVAMNVDSANTNYRMMAVGYNGSMRQDTAVTRSGGASDGTTPISLRMETTSQYYPLSALESLPLEVWNETVGTPITVAVHVLTDGVTLKDDEAWLEVSYLDSTGSPLGAVTSDEKSNQLVAGSDQSTSSESWTTTGITTPVKQVLSVTFTPQKKGIIRAVVKIARSNTVVYACPKIEVT